MLPTLANNYKILYVYVNACHIINIYKDYMIICALGRSCIDMENDHKDISDENLQDNPCVYYLRVLYFKKNSNIYSSHTIAFYYTTNI